MHAPRIFSHFSNLAGRKPRTALFSRRVKSEIVNLKIAIRKAAKHALHHVRCLRARGLLIINVTDVLVVMLTSWLLYGLL